MTQRLLPGVDTWHFESLRYALRGEVGVLTLDRPHKRNALDTILRREICEVLQAIANHGVIPKALVICGSGTHFCAGGDIADMKDGDPSAETGRSRLINEYHVIVESLLSLPCPVIAAVDGVAFGAGFSLALACDYIIATQRARFCLSFLRMGVIPDSAALYTLPRIVGIQRAKALMLTTREISSLEAMDMGIVAELCIVDSLEARALQIASQLAQASPTAVSAIKQALNVSLESSLSTMLQIEANAQGVCRSTTYHRNAIDRFLNKQTPLFSEIQQSAPYRQRTQS